MALGSLVFFIVTGMIIHRKAKVKDYDYDYETVPYWMIVPIIGMLCIFGISVILWGAEIEGLSLEPNREYELEALVDSKNIDISFVGRNAVDMEYVAGIWTDSGIKMSVFPIKRSYINYTTGKPKLVVCKRRYDAKWARWLVFEPPGKYYMFYVPEGSVVSSYKLDFN